MNNDVEMQITWDRQETGCEVYYFKGRSIELKIQPWGVAHDTLKICVASNGTCFFHGVSGYFVNCTGVKTDAAGLNEVLEILTGKIENEDYPDFIQHYAKFYRDRTTKWDTKKLVEVSRSVMKCPQVSRIASLRRKLNDSSRVILEHLRCLEFMDDISLRQDPNVLQQTSPNLARQKCKVDNFIEHAEERVRQIAEQKCLVDQLADQIAEIVVAQTISAS